MTDARFRTISALVCLMGASGCRTEFAFDAGSLDAGTLDTAITDAGPMDAGSLDAGLGDAQTSLPLLPSGHHLGLMPSFELPDAVHPMQTAALADRWAQALDAGLGVARVQVSWAELEPSPGVFNLAPLVEPLTKHDAQGLHTFVLIETIDSDGFELPSDLDDGVTPYVLAGGRHLSDTVIVQRFAALLARVLPVLSAHHVWALSVGNEPDNYFDDVEPQSDAGVAWATSMGAFLAAARSTVHASAPQLAVTMTLKEATVRAGRATSISPITQVSDLGSFNYYCQDAAFQVRSNPNVAGELGALVTLLGNRPVVLQELGCPAGNMPSLISGSQTAQRDFFAAAISVLSQEPRLRAAFVFQVIDWSPALAAASSDPLRPISPLLADQVRESLSTAGLVRWADGSARPAWSTVLSGISSVRSP